MSEKYQAARDDGQEDLLEQIIAQGLSQAKAGSEPPADETPAGSAPAAGEAAAPAAEKKNRRSSVYLYLLILFSAAFLMLLLAYFVQQRSSETTISDLRESMTHSREELLDEIRTLENKINVLDEELDHYKGESEQWRTYYHEKEQEAVDLQNQYNTALSQLSGWKNYWLLEQSYQAGEYEDCVAILILEHMTEDDSAVPPEAADRYVEIIQELADRGFLPEDEPIRASDYQDLIDAYLAEHPEFHGPTGWANINYED